MNYKKFILKTIASFFDMEIANKIEDYKNYLIVTLGDNSKAKISVKKFYQRGNVNEE